MTVISQLQFYKKYKNKYIKIGGMTANSVDWNGTNGYAGQCATLGREYLYQCYGYQNKSYGNGSDYKNIPKGKHLNKPEDWCLIVWPKQIGLPYGHVAIYYKQKMISQNPNKTTLMTIWKGTKYYIKPYQYQKPVLLDRRVLDCKDYKVKKFSKTMTFFALQNIKVRYGGNIFHGTFKKLKKGDIVKATYYTDYRGYRWIFLRYGNRYYMAPLYKITPRKKYFNW